MDGCEILHHLRWLAPYRWDVLPSTGASDFATTTLPQPKISKNASELWLSRHAIPCPGPHLPLRHEKREAGRRHVRHPRAARAAGAAAEAAADAGAEAHAEANAQGHGRAHAHADTDTWQRLGRMKWFFERESKS